MIQLPSTISVTRPVGQAIQRVKLLLFSPFDFSRWLAIGCCAWLAHLGEQSSSAGARLGQRWRKDSGSLREDYELCRDYIVDHWTWIVPLVVTLLLFGLVLGVVLTWLNSRGKFMFLHCVAGNRAEVARPWAEFARQAHSLLLFRLLCGLIGLILALPLLVPLVIVILRMVEHGAPDFGGIALLVGLGLALCALGALTLLIQTLLVDFVVPIMFLRRNSCLAAWRELQGLITPRFGEFVLYVLFRVVLALALAALVVLVVILTCCIAGCCMLLPFVGTLVLLPLLVFKRAYSLHYLAQHGAELDVFHGGAESVSP